MSFRLPSSEKREVCTPLKELSSRFKSCRVILKSFTHRAGDKLTHLTAEPLFFDNIILHVFCPEVKCFCKQIKKYINFKKSSKKLLTFYKNRDMIVLC